MSEIRPGYKQTEVGVIPEDWEVANLGEKTIKVGSGITPTGGEKVYQQTGRVFLRSQNIGWGNLILDDVAFIDEKTHSSFNTTEIDIDDVFLNITGASIGRSALADVRVASGNVNQHVCIIRANKAQLFPQYLNCFLLSTQGQKQIDSFQAGGNRQGLNFAQIRSFRISLPPTLAEQTAIAAVLSDTDTLIQKLDQLIAKKRNVKQGAMQELLTGKRRLPGFSGECRYKQTEVGVIPEDWDVQRLGDISEITKLAGFEYTRYFNSYKNGGEIIVIRGTNITNNKLDLEEIKTIPTTTSEKLPRSKLKKGDLVFAYVGTIGPVYLIQSNDKYHLGPNTARITSNEKLLPQFAYCYFTSDLAKGEMILHTSIGAQPSLSMSKIRRFRISLPPTLTEQTAIATVLSDMDAEIAALEQKRDKYKAVKQGMMQVLLTAKVRLV